ncbi:MAG: hypothetical protein ACPG53_04915 [Schleiferiaceae bacterium]
MRQLFAILFLLTCSLASAQIMDTTLLDEVEVRESRPEDERTLVKGKDIEFTTGAEPPRPLVLTEFHQSWENVSPIPDPDPYFVAEPTIAKMPQVIHPA